MCPRVSLHVCEAASTAWRRWGRVLGLRLMLPATLLPVFLLQLLKTAGWLALVGGGWRAAVPGEPEDISGLAGPLRRASLTLSLPAERAHLPAGGKSLEGERLAGHTASSTWRA